MIPHFTKAEKAVHYPVDRRAYNEWMQDGRMYRSARIFFEETKVLLECLSLLKSTL